MSETMSITLAESQEISQVVANTSETLDAILQPMLPQEKAIYLRDSLIGLENLRMNITQAMLNFLWRIYSNQLWMIPLEDNVQYGSFRDWVDAQLDPTFKRSKFEKDPKWDWLQDAVRIIERTLTYAMAHPATDNKGELITPLRLIEDVGFGKMKITSSKFMDNTKTPEREELMKDLITMPASKLRKVYTTPRIPALHAALDARPTGLADVYFMGLTANQVGLLRSALGDMNLVEHTVHMYNEDRDALLALLPIDAQQQVEEEVAETRQSDVE